MFRNFFTLFLAMAIFSVQASASTHDGLKAAFDEMNYSLSVEWDQKDQAFYETNLKKFTSTIRELQKAGLTNEEMITFTKSQIKDAKVAKDLETALSVITINKMDTEEASKYMMNSMKRVYSEGAAWSGGVAVSVVVVLVLATLLIAAAASTPSRSIGYNTCYDDCYYYDYQCGYDWFGYAQYCTDYTCDTVCY